MPTIVSVAHLVATSGIDLSTAAVQIGGPSSTTTLSSSVGADQDEKIVQGFGIFLQEKVNQSIGASIDEKIQEANPDELSQDLGFILFDPDFSRSIKLFEVIGASGIASAPRFFDRSPFFFSPSEVDPSRMRDFSESLQFLIFTQTTIIDFDPFEHTSSFAHLVTAESMESSSFAHVLTVPPVSSGVTSAPFTLEAEESIIITDETPPFFAQESPAGGTTFNDSTDNSLAFHVQDAGSDVDQATIDVFVDGLQVVGNGAVITGTLWPVIVKTVVSSNDVLYTLTRSGEFDPQSTVVVSGTFADNASPPNVTTEVYDFTFWGTAELGATISGAADVDPPVSTPIYPVNGAVQVSPDADISWSVTDNSAGVDPTELRFYINGSLVIENDVAIEGSFSRSVNASRGFDYVYSPAEDLAFGTTVTGTIESTDYVGNSDTFEYSFTITSDDTLEIINFFLGENESTLITSGTLGSVEVVDLTYGVASGTTTLLQNGEEPIGLIATYSGAGPDRIIFTWPIEPNVDFREDLFIEIHAENKFPGPFPVVQEANYLLEPGYQVDWYNKDIVGSGTNISEITFPYLSNVRANTQIKNFAKNFSTGSAYVRWLTESQAKQDLSAVLISNIETGDLSASINALSPYFAYGKEMTLEVEVADLDGNVLSFVHTFTIEEG